MVLVAPGCKMALALAMMALIEPGDEVLYPDPGFPIYPSFTRGLGAVAVPYALARKEGISARLDRDRFENHAEDPRADLQFAEQSNRNRVFSEAALSRLRSWPANTICG